MLLKYHRGMSGANCIISLGATDWTGAVRQPEGSYQPELSAKCCRLPLRDLDEQQSVRQLASVRAVNVDQACQTSGARSFMTSHALTFDISKLLLFL
jgi:hypothetical protein